MKRQRTALAPTPTPEGYWLPDGSRPLLERCLTPPRQLRPPVPHATRPGIVTRRWRWRTIHEVGPDTPVPCEPLYKTRVVADILGVSPSELWKRYERHRDRWPVRRAVQVGGRRVASRYWTATEVRMLRETATGRVHARVLARGESQCPSCHQPFPAGADDAPPRGSLT